MTLIRFQKKKKEFKWLRFFGYHLSLNSVFCHFIFLLVYTSVYLTVSFTLERYISVCHPLRGQVLCTESRAKRVICGNKMPSMISIQIISMIVTIFFHSSSLSLFVFSQIVIDFCWTVVVILCFLSLVTTPFEYKLHKKVILTSEMSANVSWQKFKFIYCGKRAKIFFYFISFN